MSLEDKIGELTAAVNALTAAMAHPYPTLADIDAKYAAKGIVVTHTSAPAEVAPPKPQAAPADTPPAAVTPISGSGTPEATPTIEYAQVAKAITDLFKVDRAKVIEVLAKFGATKGPQLKPADYAAFLKELAA
jgi:hypothetical protein